MYDALRPIRRLRNLVRFRKYYDAPVAVDFEGFGEIRNEKFPRHGPDCWLDRPDAAREIDRRLKAGRITSEEATACRFWMDNGYLVFHDLIDAASLDKAWAAYEAALADGAFGDSGYVDEARSMHDRTLDPHLKIDDVKALQRHAGILKWTDLLLGRKTVPFQTILGHAGSEQAAHSDAIHMTTYPLGYLIAAWIAFEDIAPDSGPLEYYPGSHKLPYLLSSEADIAEYEFKYKGYEVYHERYEHAARESCEKAGLRREVFLPKKGGVLLWHANLVHGGMRRSNPALSRKALVCHYFGDRAVTYHDLSGNASRLHAEGLYAPMVL